MSFSRSASQLSSYRRCPRQWQHRYLDKWKFQTAWGIKGTALHQAIALNYRQKIETRQDLPIEEVLAHFEATARGMVATAAEPVVWFPGESLDQVLEDGRAQLRVYQEVLAPGIQPILVEERVTMTLASGLQVVGILDLVDEALVVHDAKFPVDGISAKAAAYESQPPIYAALFEAHARRLPTGLVFDVVSRGRAKLPKPTATTVPVTVTPASIAAALADLEAVDVAIEARIFPRHPGEQTCNKCVYRRVCWEGAPDPYQPAPVAPAPDPDLTAPLQASLDVLAASA
jgi:CRISPR/Cas system-associated exonuclease Cas4 (RecB family)